MIKTASANIFQKATPAFTFLALTFFACIANGQPAVFFEDFSGPGLDPAWNQGGNPASHPAVIAGTYDMTHVNGDPDGGTKLSRSTPGTLSNYTHEIDVVLNPFGLSGGGGTQSDFKWKSFGADGFMEIVLNSFGDMRLFHNDADGGSGNVDLGGGATSTNIGYTDGDLLKLTTVYNQGTDTLDVTYSLNGGSAVSFYSGGGIDGPVGDLITSFVEAEVFKFGSNLPDQPVVAIDSWSLVPEPTSATLLGIAGLFLLNCGSRCRREARRSRA